MALNLSTKLTGAKQAITHLTKSKQVANAELMQGTQAVLNDFVEGITTYPPETTGNRPPPPYWSRGVGMIRAGGEINPPSQRFGESWHTDVQPTANGARGIAKTDVTYAPWVVGSTKQSWFHKLHGWQTVRQVLQRLGFNADEFTEKAFGDVVNPHLKAAVTRIEQFLSRIS